MTGVLPYLIAVIQLHVFRTNCEQGFFCGRPVVALRPQVSLEPF